jgi:hypothetical protein
MNCPFCREEDIGRAPYCPNCGIGREGLNDAQIVLLSGRIREENRNAVILCLFVGLLAGSISIGFFIGSMITVGVCGGALLLCFVFMYRSARSARELEWVLNWWGKNKK